jgi:hypothetical protein
VSSQATVKKKTRSTTHPLGIIFNKFSLALQTHPAWHGFNDIPQNLSINNSIANRLKEHLLYQLNQFLQPKLKCLTYMWLRLGLLILIQTHFHRSYLRWMFRSFSNFWVYSQPISTKFTILWITRTLLRHFQRSKPQLETKKIIETFNTRWRCEKNFHLKHRDKIDIVLHLRYVILASNTKVIWEG